MYQSATDRLLHSGFVASSVAGKDVTKPQFSRKFPIMSKAETATLSKAVAGDDAGLACAPIRDGLK